MISAVLFLALTPACCWYTAVPRGSAAEGRAALTVAVVEAVTAAVMVSVHQEAVACLNAAVSAYYAWIWWRNGGGGDTRRRLRRWAARFRGVRGTAPAPGVV